MQIAYPIALFVHILGAIGIFVGMSLELALMLRLRRTETVGQMREALWFGQVVARIMSIAPLVTFLAGLFMTVTTWGLASAWLDVALPLFFVLAALGSTVTSGHFKALAGAAFTAPDGPVPQHLRAHILDPLFNTVLQTMAALTVGIVFLMSVKPNLVASLAVVAVACTAGYFSAEPIRRASRAFATAQPAPTAAAPTARVRELTAARG
jgi:hypothetical protein